MNLAEKQLNQVLDGKVKINEPIGAYIDLGIGGPAEFLFIANSEKDFIKAKQIANMLGITYTVFNPHQNVLVSMNGLKGLIIIYDDKQISDIKKVGKLFKDIKIDKTKLRDLLSKGLLETNIKIGDVLLVKDLIKKIDLQNKQIGGIKLSDENLNKIINIGGGTTEDAIILISIIKQQVRDKLGIQLQEEIKIIGG